MSATLSSHLLPVSDDRQGYQYFGTYVQQNSIHAKVMRTCMSCNCYYCQTQIEKHNLSDTGYQLSLHTKTDPHFRLPSVDTQSNLGGIWAVEGSQRGGQTLDQRIFMSSEMIWFHIMSILQPDTSLICVVASQNVTFLFRRPYNIWRTIVLWFFFCQSFRVLCLIISYLRKQWIAASLLTLLCQVNVPCLSGDGRKERGYLADSELMIYYPTTHCCFPKETTDLILMKR